MAAQKSGWLEGAALNLLHWGLATPQRFNFARRVWRFLTRKQHLAVPHHARGFGHEHNPCDRRLKLSTRETRKTSTKSLRRIQVALS